VLGGFASLKECSCFVQNCTHIFAHFTSCCIASAVCQVVVF
jgi:hypothetical protein